MKKSIVFLIGIFIILSACSESTPSQVPVAEPSNTSTPVPSPTRTATLSPTVAITITPTPAPTDTPTPTPLPSPTPTPEGYYISESGHFSIICPYPWQIIEEEGSVYCNNEERGLYFAAFMELTDEGYSINEFIDEIDQEFGVTHEVVQKDEILLKDGKKADRIIVTYPGEMDITAHYVFYHEPPRFYGFMGMGPKIAMDINPRPMEQVFESIQIKSGQIYGLDREKTLVLMGDEPFPEDLDPARMTDSAAHYVGHIYSGLVRLSPDLQIEPDLAEAWSISPDGTVYTFTLRSGLVFQSGRELTSEDIKYSWERAADPQTDSTTAATYLGDILGVKQKLDGGAGEIAGIKIIDERTIAVTLDGSKPYFLAKLTYPTSFIVNQENIEANPDNWMYEPDASGPYGLQEYREDEALIFLRNENYHTPPTVKHVVYLLYRAGNPISYYKAGDIDITGISNLDAKNIMDNVDNQLNDELLSTTSMCTTYLHLNNNRPPMDDLKVRQALALSVDKAQINELFDEDLSMVANSILPPAMPGFSINATTQTYDPYAAKQAMDDSGYAGYIPPIVINTPGYSDEDSLYINALIDMWLEALGVDISVEYVNPQHMMEELRNADGHIAVIGWCADYPDPENFLDILFHSDSLFNSSNYSNPDIDKLLEQAREELDPDIRLALYQEIEARLLEDYAVIPISHDVTYKLVNPRIKGFQITPLGAPIIHLLSIKE